MAIIALEQLHIAEALLNILFTALVAALALAFGLAFGLGGRESAQRWLARGESSLESATAQMSRPQGASGLSEMSAQPARAPEYSPPRDGAGVSTQKYQTS